MNSAILFIALLLWQQGQERAQKITPTTDAPVWNLNENFPGCAPLHTDRLHGGWFLGVDDKGCYIEIAPPPPFDVAPVETKEIFAYEDCKSVADDDPVVNCTKPIYRLTGRECTDKSRFLLMSEDGRWHCLRLAEKP